MATRTQILITARDGASSVFGKVAKSSTKAQKRIFGVNNALQSTDKSMKALSGSVKGLAAGAAGVFGLGALAASLKDAVAIKVEYDKINNVLKAVTGSSSKAAQEFGFLSEEAERLGIQLRPLAQSYTRLSAAGQLLGLTTEDTREIFTSFSEALTGFGATREQSIRVFTAIEQILSKGKVSAEELRQQLGEALPGSFQLAAKAAGVTVQELDGMLKRGELLSSEFILPFAKAVRTQFGGAAVEGAKLLNAEFSRTINVLDKVKLAIVEGGDAGDSLADTLARILKDFREFIGNEDRLKSFADAGRTLGTGLELAAKSIQTIATVISKIPSEALIALGAIALGGSRTKGAGAATIQALSPVVAAPVAQRSAFDTIRGQRNFLPSVVQGGINDSNLRGVQGILGARAGFSASEVLRRERRDLASRLFSRPRSRKAQLGPDSLLSPSQAFSGQFGPQKLAESFQKTFVPAVEKVNKSIKERLAPTLSKLGTGAAKIGEAFKSLGASLLGVFSPVNILIGGLGVLAGKFFELKEEQKKLAFFEDKGEKAARTAAAAAAARFAFDSGATGSLAGLDRLKEILDPQGLGLDDATISQMERFFNNLTNIKDEAAAAAEAVKSFIDPTRAVVDAFSGGTADIKQYAADVKEFGVERAKELQQVRELAAKLEEENVVKKEAIKLAREQVATQREANKAEETAKRAREAAKSTKDFQKGTSDLQKENAARAKGASEAAIDAAKRLRDYRDALTSSGVAAEEASKLARERVKAENERAKQLKKPESRTLESRAVGVARSARSVEVATQKQQRIEDQRFRQSQDLLTRIADSLGNIEDNNNNLSIGIL